MILRSYSCKNLSALCADYLIIFRYLLTFFFATFFQKEASKDHLTQINFLKAMLLNEKQSNLQKEMHGNISLYCQYFSPGTGSNVHKTYSKFLKLRKSILFCQKRSKKVQNKNTTDWNVSLQRVFSAIIVYARNIFATIRLQSFSLNFDENEVCTKKKSIEYLRKLTQIHPRM